ncbi:MAG TPA: GNAT family N-acetyltransferase [Acidimicrobiales bacterium]|nr:GNAT family N-acetyltransferase [Acidimicrobiales bacterium]
MRIREAGVDDVEAITALTNALIPTTTYEWREAPFSVEDRRAWLAAKAAAGMPVLVADDGGDVVGWAGYGDFRDTGRWPGYRFTVEHTVHVREDHRGRGVGRRLMEALLDRALADGKRVMVAAIDASNVDSVLFHERLGFAEVGRLPGVGEKFGHRLDLVLMQRDLTS